MAQLRQDYARFRELNTEIIAIGPEDRPTFAQWWREHNMPFTGIADPQHTVARLYGQEVKILKLGRLPAGFIVDRAGLIRFQYFGQSMSDIPGNSTVLAEIEAVNREAAQV